MNVQLDERLRPLTARERLTADLLFWPTTLSLRMARAAFELVMQRRERAPDRQ
jgi:hypothetical protein